MRKSEAEPSRDRREGKDWRAREREGGRARQFGFSEVKGGVGEKGEGGKASSEEYRALPLI